jgi:hypothetical protein
MMRIDKDKIWRIIDDVVVTNLNKEEYLFGNISRKISKEDLYSLSRKRECVLARQICHYIGKFIFEEVLDINITLTAIGELYHRDHATIIYSIKTINNLYETDNQILRLVLSCQDAAIRRIKEGEGVHKSHRWYTYLYPKSELY